MRKRNSQKGMVGKPVFEAQPAEKKNKVMVFLAAGSVILLCAAILITFLVKGRLGRGRTMMDIADRNKDGQIDSWVYRNYKNILVKHVRDRNFDGKQDSWEFFEDGEVFLEEKDNDSDGKVDSIRLVLFDSPVKNKRALIFRLQDREKNVFVREQDSGWRSMSSQ